MATTRVEEHRVVASKDHEGRHVFCALVKRTYCVVNGRSVRAEHDRPFDPIDVYYQPGDPETSSVQYENDLTPFKIATDVVVVGTVYAPGGSPATVVDAGIEIANRHKVIRAFGDRKCAYNPRGEPFVSDPLPFTELPLVYERAYGGTDAISIPEMPFSYPRNHLGRGFLLKNLRETVDGRTLPNFEDPEDLLTPERIIVGDPEGWSQQPLPQGLGWFQRTWYPRCSFVGSVPGFVDPDVTVREEELGLVPRRQFALARQFKLPSFDIRFNNGASPGLAVPPLQGGELIQLTQLTPDGSLQFPVPNDRPKMMMNIGLGDHELEPVLHTVLIRSGELEIDLIWRGAHEYPGIEWLPEMKQLKVEIQ